MSIQSKTRTPSACITRFAAVAAAALICGSGEAPASNVDASETTAIAQIERYCLKSWQSAHMPRHEWNDSTQQVLAELLERIPREKLTTAIRAGTSDERRELNRSIWRIVKRWVRQQRHASLEDVEVAMPTEKANDEIDERIEQVLQIASSQLSEQQRRIIEMMRQGATVAQIAQSMNLPAARISNQKHRAIKQIRRYLCDAA